MAQISEHASEFQIIRVIDGDLMGSQCVETAFSVPFSCAFLLQNPTITLHPDLTWGRWAAHRPTAIKQADQHQVLHYCVMKTIILNLFITDEVETKSIQPVH